MRLCGHDIIPCVQDLPGWNYHQHFLSLLVLDPYQCHFLPRNQGLWRHTELAKIYQFARPKTYLGFNAELNWRGFQLHLVTQISLATGEHSQMEHIFDQYLPFAIIFGLEEPWVEARNKWLHSIGASINKSVAWFLLDETVEPHEPFSQTLLNFLGRTRTVLATVPLPRTSLWADTDCNCEHTALCDSLSGSLILSDILTDLTAWKLSTVARAAWPPCAANWTN